MPTHKNDSKTMGKCVLFPFLACLCLFFGPAPAWANGGPMDITEIVRTGNVRLTKAEDIRLAEETLEIVLMEDMAHVRVTYTLKNTGPDAEVGFAFPVDFSPEILEYYPERTIGIEYAIFEDDAPLEFVATEDEQGPPAMQQEAANEVGNNFGWLTDSSLKRTWYVSTLAFGAGQEKTVEIEYATPVLWEDLITNKSFLPDFSSRVFLYDPSPAAGWGDGRIGRLSIVVNNTSNEALGGKTLDLAPKGFKETSPGVYRLELVDADPAEMGHVLVEYDIGDLKLSRYYTKKSVSGDRVLSITASSTLEDKAAYAPANIMDRDFNTAWFPKGDGKGEWIEITFERFTLSGIVVAGGYTKSRELYYANSRPAGLNVEFFPVSDAQYMRTDELGPRPLEDTNYDLFNQETFSKFVQIVSDLGEGGGTGGRVRLTITGAYPGTKYKDVGISEIYLVGWPRNDAKQ